MSFAQDLNNALFTEAVNSNKIADIVNIIKSNGPAQFLESSKAADRLLTVVRNAVNEHKKELLKNVRGAKPKSGKFSIYKKDIDTVELIAAVQASKTYKITGIWDVGSKGDPVRWRSVLFAGTTDGKTISIYEDKTVEISIKSYTDSKRGAWNKTLYHDVLLKVK